MQLLNNDLVITNNKFSRLTDTKDALTQQITNQVKMFYNEWFSDSEIGIDYIGFENKRYSDAEIISSIRNSLLANPNISIINSITVSRNRQTRVLSITIDVETTEGSAIIII